MDHSELAELVDAIHVAVGLRLVSVVLFGPAVRGENTTSGTIDLLVIVDDELPTDPSERAAYLTRRTPEGTLDRASIVLKSPVEFDADPPDLYQAVAASGRILLDVPGFATDRLARIRGQTARES